MSISPELEKAITLNEYEQAIELTDRLKEATEARPKGIYSEGHAALGRFLGSLLADQVDALESQAEVLAGTYVRLAIKAGAVGQADVDWFKLRLAGWVSGEGIVRTLSDRAKAWSLPEGIVAHAQRKIGAARSRAVLRTERMFAEEAVVFEELMTDVVTIHTADGQSHENVRAVVERGKILIHRVDIPIQLDDRVTRRTRAGVEETFVVEDPGFHEAFGEIPASYQMVVRRADAALQRHSQAQVRCTGRTLASTSIVSTTRLTS